MFNVIKGICPLLEMQVLNGTIQALAAAVGSRDPQTCDHSKKVARLATATARIIGLPEDEVQCIRRASLLHDIGKVGIPDHILFKPGPLSGEEFAKVKEHCEIGYSILKSIPQLKDVASLVRSHHERWDGRGYPDGLAGEEIPLGARIIAVADAFEAMTAARVYRPARDASEALGEIMALRGCQFDPEVAEAFVQVADMLTRAGVAVDKAILTLA